MVRHADEVSSANHNHYEGPHIHNAPQYFFDSRGSPNSTAKAEMRDKFPAGLAPPGPREATSAPSTAGEFETRLYAWLEDCNMEQPERECWREYIRKATGFAHTAGVPAALQYHHAAFARYMATPCKYDPTTDGPTDDMSFMDNVRSPLKRAEAASRRPRQAKPTYNKSGDAGPANFKRQRSVGGSASASTPRTPGYCDYHGDCFHTTAACHKAASDPKRQRQDKPTAAAASKA